MNTYDLLPKPLSNVGSLDDLLINGTSKEEDYNVFIGHNLGYRVFLLQIPMRKFYEISEVANDQQASVFSEIAQRRLDPGHAHKLAIYILKGLVSSAISHRKISNKEEIPELELILEQLGKQPYISLQPLVANLRDVGLNGKNIRGERVISKEDGTTACFKVYLAQNNILWIIDGQHRREGMKIVFEFLEHVIKTKQYQKRKSSIYTPSDGHLELTVGESYAWESVLESARSFATIAIEVHLGLGIDEERQLFHDLNNLGKKIDKNLALKFDSSNPINLFIKDTLIDKVGIEVTDYEQKNWNDDDGKILLKDLVSINAILFLNKTNVSSATQDVKDKYKVARRAWEAISAIQSFGEPKSKLKSIIMQPVVLKAIAKLVYDFSFSQRKPENSEQYLTILLDNLTNLNWGHDNQIWQYYNLEIDVKNKFFPGLDEYLPSNETGNRDIGSLQNDLMRFGAKHNDIYPIIADMIRWQLKLPNRHGK